MGGCCRIFISTHRTAAHLASGSQEAGSVGVSGGSGGAPCTNAPPRDLIQQTYIEQPPCLSPARWALRCLEALAAGHPAQMRTNSANTSSNHDVFVLCAARCGVKRCWQRGTKQGMGADYGATVGITKDEFQQKYASDSQGAAVSGGASGGAHGARRHLQPARPAGHAEAAGRRDLGAVRPAGAARAAAAVAGPAGAAADSGARPAAQHCAHAASRYTFRVDHA